MKNRQKLALILLLGALSISSTLPADHSTDLEENSLYQYLGSTSKDVKATYNRISDAAKNSPIKTLCALTVLARMGYTNANLDYFRSRSFSELLFPQRLRTVLSNAVNLSSHRTRSWIKNNPVKAMCTFGALVALGYKAYKYYLGYRDKRTAEPLVTILHNPLTSLNDLYRINNQFESTFKTEKLDDFSHPDDQALEKLNSLIQSHEQKSPIFLLGECTQEGEWSCMLSRTYQSKYREQFEKRVVDALVAKTESCDNAVQYVGFGSGHMYQDLVVLCKTLTSNPNASLSVHLIDPQYSCFTDIRDAMNLDRQVKPDTHTNLLQSMPELIKVYREKIEDNYTLDNEISKTIQVVYTKGENTARQFITFLHKAFPKASLSLYLHDSHTAYLGYITKHNIAYPDVICAADIDDEMSRMQGSLPNYIILSKKALQKKPNAFNMLLTKLDPKTEGHMVQLVTISLDEVAGAIKSEPDQLNEQTGTVFLAVENI